jgi:hypothetical protein
MKRVYIYLSLIIFTITSCKSTKYNSDYNHSVDFSQYKTFGFSDLSQKLPVDDIVKKRIFTAIENNLVAKGFQKSDSPDLLVDLGLQLDKKKNYSNNNVNLRGYFGKKRRLSVGVGKTFSNDKEYTVGTLVLNLVDAISPDETLVWKGNISGVVKPESSSQENITSSINQLFSSFPPN